MSALGSARVPRAAGSASLRDAATRPRILQVIPSFRVGGLESGQDTLRPGAEAHACDGFVVGGGGQLDPSANA